MKFFIPDFYFKSITDIPINFLKSLKPGVNCILLDVDETIVPRGSPDVPKNVRKWLTEASANNIKIVLVSNNFKKRVKAVADTLNLPYVCKSLKPLVFGIKKAIKMVQCKKETSILIGDQIFTDILGANLCGIKSILVNPISGDKGTIFSKIKRLAEKFSHVPK
jgi:HAD superfamily phosphatase (TIGR01668 family)